MSNDPLTKQNNMKLVIFLILCIIIKEVVMNAVPNLDKRIERRAAVNLISAATASSSLLDEPACVAIRALCANAAANSDDFYMLECIQTLRGDQKNLIGKRCVILIAVN